MVTPPNEKDLMWHQLSYCGCNATEENLSGTAHAHDRLLHIRGARPHVDVAVRGRDVC
jgi:hypothetical protein